MAVTSTVCVGATAGAAVAGETGVVSEDRCQDPLLSRNLETGKAGLDVSGPA
jgi:hypothetical protein